MPIILLLVVVVVSIVTMRNFQKKMQMHMNRYFGSNINNISQLLQAVGEAKEDRENRPRSLNDMERVYLPMIEKDYPELRVAQLKSEAETYLLKSYESLKTEDYSFFKGQNQAYFLQSLRKAVMQNRNRGELALSFDQVKIHRSALSRYGYDGGHRIIDFQFAVQAMVSGNRYRVPEKKQMCDTIRFQLLDDLARFRTEGTADGVIGKNCPNCGAPLPSIHSKSCPFCGSNINIKELDAWLPSEIMPEYWARDSIDI